MWISFSPSDACSLTLDPNTAHCELLLSEGDKKVTRGEKHPYPDLPERFSEVPQVLCREELTCRCYWEVECKAYLHACVDVGVCYKQLERKGNNDACRLGNNTISWCFTHHPDQGSDENPVSFCAKHNNESKYYPVPPTGCPRLGVFLDWVAGTLSFYCVSSDKLSQIHTFRTKFSEPVYPAFLIHNQPEFRISNNTGLMSGFFVLPVMLMVKFPTSVKLMF